VAATIKQNVAKPPCSGADGHERSECKRAASKSGYTGIAQRSALKNRRLRSTYEVASRR